MASLRQAIYHLTFYVGLSVLKLHKGNSLNSFGHIGRWLSELVQSSGWCPPLAVATVRARCSSSQCRSLASGLVVILLFTCLLTHLEGWLATCFQSLHERLHINPCHNLLCLLPPLKLLVSPKDLPSVTIHLLHFYAPQLSKHECLSNPISHYLPVEVPWGRGNGEAPILAGCPGVPGPTLQPGTCPVLKKISRSVCLTLSKSEDFYRKQEKIGGGRSRKRCCTRGFW